MISIGCPPSTSTGALAELCNIDSAILLNMAGSSEKSVDDDSEKEGCNLYVPSTAYVVKKIPNMIEMKNFIFCLFPRIFL